MSNTNIFPDQSHVEQIRNRLWCGQEFGQAAVMIGAGFSQNAERISSNVSPFPLWDEIAKLMYNSLNPQGTLSEQNIEKSISGKDALKLASEYEIFFGRSALDDLIIHSIPDTNYLPGQLHELLLSLPWSDVFTTNYDTLLERTQPAIHDRKYDPILTSSDIPSRMKPRIVKLHGSFPSHRPFIITEEDYRTYPKKFAPFVNMVQQSIMENVFCLIGFSGDDPNFLYWSGWVRDNLESAALPIYLCGLLSLSPSERRVLESRNIIPIDLSPQFPKSDWANSNLRYAKALEWFLLTLMYGEPPNIMTWPIYSAKNIWKPSDGLPPIPSGPHLTFDNGKLQPDVHRSLQEEDLEEQYEIWRHKRLKYPGWVVAPKENRETLWRYTEYWIDPLLHFLDKLPPPKNLFLLYELNWRLETTLTPLFMDWIEKIVPIIESFNPYPQLIEINNASIRPDKDEYKQLDWELIGKSWIELLFAIAREAREDQDEKRFRLWMDILEKVVKQRLEWQIRWFYEECLFYLFCFNQEKINKTLKNWPETLDLSFGEVKRASILAELGELNEAEKIGEEALSRIRSRLQPFSLDYTLLSQEGWTMVLLKAIKDNKFGTNRDFVGDYRDRWERLGNYRCNPWPDIELLASIVKGAKPSTIPEKEIKKEFDPRKITVTHHFSPGLDTFKVLPAFGFLRIFEEGALPIMCGSVGMFSEAVVNSSKWIEPFAPFWSLSSMIRTGKDKEIKEWFNRIFVATLTQEEANHLYSLFTNSLKQSIQHLTRNPQLIGLTKPSFSQRQVVSLSELLSRLCFRFSTDQISLTFKLTVDMYRMHLFHQHHILYDCVDTLFKRIFYAMPQSELLQRIPELISLPIPTESGFEVRMPELWTEPFSHIEFLKSTKLESNFDRSTFSAPIANLIRIVKDGTPEARKRASLRLEILYKINGLTVDECKFFGEALWSKIDSNKGLPSDTVFYDFAFLDLPEIKSGIAKENFRKYLLKKDFPRIVQYSTNPEGKKTKSISGPQDNRFVQEWRNGTLHLFPSNHEKQRFIDWTADEVTQLLKKAVAWWDDEKGELLEKHLPFLFDIRDPFSGLIPLISYIILPRLENVDNEIKILAKKLLFEMEEYGFCVLSALPMILFIDITSYDEISRKIRAGLNSTKQEEVRDSIFGFFNWLVHSSRQNIPSPPNDFLIELINKVVYRRQPGLNSAIGQISIIIEKLPDILNENQIESLCIALEYLIKETELPSRKETEEISKLQTTIPVGDRPDYRELAAKLAYKLFINFTNRNKEIPQILIKWKDICQIDPLPEVRRVWCS